MYENACETKLKGKYVLGCQLFVEIKRQIKPVLLKQSIRFFIAVSLGDI
jgi:hypothetical protein